jgi:pyruvate/2-oxoglutarate dehydrogenase complex dihydrolipoamide acyltransferase (E2) component
VSWRRLAASWIRHLQENVPSFTVRIPRTSVAVSEATLTGVLVEDGQSVNEGDPLFVIETEKVETEIDAGASGTVHWTGEVGTVYPIGTEIGAIE